MEPGREDAKYFLLKNQDKNYLKMTVINNKICSSSDAYSDDQLFYEDAAAGTIRAKTSGLSLGVDTSREVVLENTQKPQLWTRTSAGLVRTVEKNQSLVIAVHAGDGQPVVMVPYNGLASQRWTIKHETREYFRIQNDVGLKMLEAQSPEAGSKVVVRSENANNKQQWFEDSRGFIRSKINGFFLDTLDDPVVLGEYCQASPDQTWCFKNIGGDMKIVNEVDQTKCLECVDAETVKVATVDSANRYQVWSKEPVYKKKGQVRKQ